MRVSWTSLLHVAGRSLRQHKLRSSLTMLGIIIGVTSVVVMIGVGSGAQSEIQSQIASLGSNFLIVMPGSLTRGGLSGGSGTALTLTPEDAQAVQRECPSVQYASAGVRTIGRVVAGNANWSTYLSGAGAVYTTVREWPVANGEFFTDADVNRAAKVVVLGQTVVRELFGSQHPVGQYVRIKGLPFRVIGVLSPKGQTAWGQDQDDIAIMPYTTVMKRVMGVTNIGVILVSAKSEEQMMSATEEITTLLHQRHRIPPGEDDDFNIRNQREIAEMFETTSKIMSVLLGAIASISLIVGGIGIMNIMLVSVTERTREIGIRMAVGARGRDILAQFLIEAAVLSSFGGVVALGVGWSGCALIRSALGWPVQLSAHALVLAWGFAALVGIGFGLYPALKASQLNPIEALRYE